MNEKGKLYSEHTTVLAFDHDFTSDYFYRGIIIFSFHYITNTRFTSVCRFFGPSRLSKLPRHPTRDQFELLSQFPKHLRDTSKQHRSLAIRLSIAYPPRSADLSPI
ncbi:hypothetical protein E2C01_049329 [Portunus trituberculatus]|uniref:Uncharacterized protein n=1 Tax=Portunus trituberculatus TaxID=210409 RepID=A0A5B7GFS2_PORTR|nr:hypothetical protein [Portunus trituberculatus]